MVADNELVRTSYMSLTSVNSYALEAPAWACEWNREDDNILYCSMRNNLVLFDIRQTKTHLAKYSPRLANRSSFSQFLG